MKRVDVEVLTQGTRIRIAVSLSTSIEASLTVLGVRLTMGEVRSRQEDRRESEQQLLISDFNASDSLWQVVGSVPLGRDAGQGREASQGNDDRLLEEHRIKVEVVG